jgi:hypothetical protein
MKRRNNPKRRIRKHADKHRLEQLAARVVYRGSPYHKRIPGDYGLSPPAEPRPDKTLCDGTNIDLRTAQALLRQGVLRGFVSEQERSGLPQNIWAVSNNNVPLEAQLENEGNASYHGYPMQKADPLAQEVLHRWATNQND